MRAHKPSARQRLVYRNLRPVAEPLELRRIFSVTLPLDVNNIPLSTTALGNFCDVNGTLYFSTDDALHGSELWKTDGSPAGTSMVTDLREGVAGSNPANLTNVGGKLLFSASDGIHGDCLWTTDGTGSGTRLVSTAASGPHGFAVTSSATYFFANWTAGMDGMGVWKSDGTSAGTQLVKSVYGFNGYFPMNPVLLGGTLYFIDIGGTSVGEIWRCDGTPVGTGPIKTFMNFAPSNLTVFNNALYFSVGGQVWKSDGSSAGTTEVGQVGAGGSSVAIANLTVAGGTLFFTANDGVTGSELWATNGTNLMEVKDLRAGTAGSSPANLIALNSRIYFSANDGVKGNELWSSDGTSNGTTLVKDIFAGSPSSSPTNLTIVNGMLYFAATGGTGSAGFWSSNGTDAGTSLVKNFAGYTTNKPGMFTRSGTVTYFAADDGKTGRELWGTSGTPISTQLVKDTYPATDSAGPRFIGTFQGRLYYFANDGVEGAEPWYTDGTPDGTALLKDINPGIRDAIGLLGGTSGEANSKYLFFPVSFNSSNQLWRSDGTSAGTVKVADLPSIINSWGLLNDKVYFTIDSALWSTDGTSAGTKAISSIAPKRFGNISATINGVFFSAGYDATYGVELWRSDGTDAGTYRITDLNPAGSSSPIGLTVIGNTLFFFASDSESNGNKLYKFTTATGVTLVKDVIPGGDDWYYSGIGAVGGRLFFGDSAYGPTGSEPWVSDGTSEGTHLIADLVPGAASSGADEFVDLNGVALFRAGPYNHELLYRSDGTASGTYIVKDIKPEFSGSSESQLTKVGNLVYLAAETASFQGLWSTDGTTEGTFLLAAEDPGGLNYSGQSAVIGTSLLFTADDGIHGREVWRALLDDSPLRVQQANFNGGSGGQSITYSLGRPISNVRVPVDFSVLNISTNETIAAAYVHRTTDEAGGRVTFSFPGYPNGALPAGTYQAILPAGSVIDQSGNPLAYDFISTFSVAPAIQAVIVNDGSVQRSKVTGLTLVFDSAVDLAPGAITLLGRSGAGAGTVLSWSNPSGDGRTWVVSFAGTPVIYDSLADGTYDLTVIASKVHAGSASGPAMASDYTTTFHRLFGDADGNRTVNNADAFKFSKTYLRSSADPAFLSAFDFNGDGIINNTDNFQFNKRYLMQMLY